MHEHLIRGISDALLSWILIFESLDYISDPKGPRWKHLSQILLLMTCRSFLLRFSICLELFIFQNFVKSLSRITIFLDDWRKEINLLDFISIIFYPIDASFCLFDDRWVLSASLLLMWYHVSLVKQLESMIIQVKHGCWSELLPLLRGRPHLLSSCDFLLSDAFGLPQVGRYILRIQVKLVRL